jgi:predicted AlkP superfamily pyrophosphatase or phosphodiesterase
VKAKSMFTFALCLAAALSSQVYAQTPTGLNGNISHVLLISVDGMHALDFANCSAGISGVNGGQ